MEFINRPPEWLNEGVEPPKATREEGFRAGYKPPASFFNWFWNLVGRCIKELQETLSGYASDNDAALAGKADLVGGTVPMEQLPVRVIRVRDRDPAKPDYGLGCGAAVMLRAGPYTGTAEITLQVEQAEYDAENMSARPQAAPSGTIIIRKVEE